MKEFTSACFDFTDLALNDYFFVWKILFSNDMEPDIS